MSNRQLDEAVERRRDECIARQLGVSVEVLDEYPFQIDEHSSDDGVVYGWRILWEAAAPEGVEIHGPRGSLWSEVQPAPNGEDDPDQ